MKAGKENCWACGEALENSQIYCKECKSWQNWRKYTAFSATILSLLIALISVLSFTVPHLVDAIYSPQIALDVGFDHEAVCESHCDEFGNAKSVTSQHRSVFKVHLTNIGEKDVRFAKKMECSGAGDEGGEFERPTLYTGDGTFIRVKEDLTIRYHLDLGTDNIEPRLRKSDRQCWLQILDEENKYLALLIVNGTYLNRIFVVDLEEEQKPEHLDLFFQGNNHPDSDADLADYSSKFIGEEEMQCEYFLSSLFGCLDEFHQKIYLSLFNNLILGTVIISIGFFVKYFGGELIARADFSRKVAEKRFDALSNIQRNVFDLHFYILEMHETSVKSRNIHTKEEVRESESKFQDSAEKAKIALQNLSDEYSVNKYWLASKKSGSILSKIVKGGNKLMEHYNEIDYSKKHLENAEIIEKMAKLFKEFQANYKTISKLIETGR